MLHPRYPPSGDFGVACKGAGIWQSTLTDAFGWAYLRSVSINQFVATAVAEKISALETEDYLAQRAARASRAKFETPWLRCPTANRTNMTDSDSVLLRASETERNKVEE